MKVDKSFVDDVGESAESGVLAEAIVQLGNTLHLQTVAEGIEQAAPGRRPPCARLPVRAGLLSLRSRSAVEQVDSLLSQLAAWRIPDLDHDGRGGHATMNRGMTPTLGLMPPSNGNGNGSAVHGVPERHAGTNRWEDLERLRASHPMMDAVIDEVQRAQASASATSGCVTSHPATTWASTFTRRSSSRSSAELWRWGTHPSWSRLLGSPALYVDIEEQLTELLGAPDSLVLADHHHHPHLGDPGPRR